MNELYTAKVFSGNEQFAERVGNNVDELYIWMLIEVNGNFGDIHGEVVDNATKERIKAFRKCAIE